MQVVERSSLVSVLFREAFSHPYISLFHLLVNKFSVISIYLQGHHEEFKFCVHFPINICPVIVPKIEQSNSVLSELIGSSKID